MPPLLLLILTLGAHATPMRSSRAPDCQPDSAQVAPFLSLLASAWSPASSQGGYDSSRAARWNTERLVTFFARSGTTFHDANDDNTWHLGIGELSQQLRSRRGAAYAMLLHLGYTYGLRESKLSFAADSSAVLVRLGHMYQITFVCESGGLRAAKVEYLQLEDK